jgi:hypothetical protein
MIPADIWHRINEALYRGESDRDQTTLLPESLDDFIDESNPVRAIDAFGIGRGPVLGSLNHRLDAVNFFLADVQGGLGRVQARGLHRIVQRSCAYHSEHTFATVCFRYHWPRGWARPAQ